MFAVSLKTVTDASATFFARFRECSITAVAFRFTLKLTSSKSANDVHKKCTCSRRTGCTNCERTLASSIKPLKLMFLRLFAQLMFD